MIHFSSNKRAIPKRSIRRLFFIIGNMPVDQSDRLNTAEYIFLSININILALCLMMLKEYLWILSEYI